MEYDIKFQKEKEVSGSMRIFTYNSVKFFRFFMKSREELPLYISLISLHHYMQNKLKSRLRRKRERITIFETFVLTDTPMRSVEKSWLVLGLRKSSLLNTYRNI